MLVKFKKLHPMAKVPTYGTAGAACFDLATVNGGRVRVGMRSYFNTGLAVEVPPGHVLMVYSRSGHGFNHSVRLANCVGVIDSDYRGEICICLQNDGSNDLEFFAGDRIAQAMIIAVPAVQFVEDELSRTERGANGFGSTGK